MNTQMLLADQPGTIDQVLVILNEGGLVAFPTDTVYGLGALAFNAQAIEQIFVAKGRDTAKAIAVLLGKTDDLRLVTQEMNETARRLAEHFWPGALTLVVPRHPALPSNLSPLPTIGVRMPDHPVALTLLTRSGPLAVTSANLSGEVSLTTAQEVLEQLGGRIPFVMDGGRTPGGQPSTVVDCTQLEPRILRQGPITLEKIRAVLS
jgi:L-threonylcarbamoyladenylate synthase